jgi:hypothetical protein
MTGANPKIVSYNASTVKFYNATSSLVVVLKTKTVVACYNAGVVGSCKFQSRRICFRIKILSNRSRKIFELASPYDRDGVELSVRGFKWHKVGQSYEFRSRLATRKVGQRFADIFLDIGIRVARLYSVQHTKTGKIYQITPKYTKCP